MQDGWRKASGLMLLLVLLVGAWGISQWDRSRRAENMLAAQLQRAFAELAGHVENVAVLLDKGRAAASPGETALHLTDAWKQAMAAQASLNMLPLAPAQRQRTSLFLTQAGDYAYRVALAAAKGDEPSPAQRQTLADIAAQAERLAGELEDVMERAYRGELNWNELQRMATARAAPSDASPLGKWFSRIEEGMMEYPTLLYDGPFSAHLSQREPRGLPQEPVSAERAREVAAEFLTLATGQAVRVEDLRPLGEAEGIVPAYRFELQRSRLARGRDSRGEAGQGTLRVDVSRQGGNVVWMMDSRPPGPPRLSVEEAVKRGEEFLASLGFADVEPVFPLRAAGRVMVPYALVQDGIPLYTDQFKLTISLEDGSVLSYFAMDYLMNHERRAIPEPRVSEGEARAAVADHLEVAGEGRLVWMADEALNEHLAYEFRAVDASTSDEYLIYIDALTGSELRIEKIVPAEEGLLVM